VVGTFRGGIRPKGARAATSMKTMRDIAPPPRVILPLSQHTGTPAKPIVKVGDAVKRGTKIAEADGFISVPVHASISGRVTAIRDFPHPAGGMRPAIEIEGDGKDEAVDAALWQDLAAAEPEAIRRAVWEAGIVGLGGAGFPTHVKLKPPLILELARELRLFDAQGAPPRSKDALLALLHQQTQKLTAAKLESSKLPPLRAHHLR